MIKPIRPELYLVYRCPKCGCEWNKTLKEVKYVKRMICDGCQKVSTFHPIKHIKIIPTYLKVPSNVKKNKSNVILTKLQEDAILALERRGFPKKESRKFVSSRNFQSVEDYIQAAVRKGIE